MTLNELKPQRQICQVILHSKKNFWDIFNPALGQKGQTPPLGCKLTYAGLFNPLLGQIRTFLSIK